MPWKRLHGKPKKIEGSWGKKLWLLYWRIVRECWLKILPQTFTVSAELYTPPYIPIGFLLDSYIPCGFPVDSTHSYVFPGVLVES